MTKLQPQGKEPGKRDTTKNHGKLGGIRQAPGYLQEQPYHLPEETGVQLRVASYAIWCRYLDTDQTIAQNKLAAAHTKMEKVYAQHHIQKDRKTSIWARERITSARHRYTQQCEETEVLLGRAHINRLKNDGWTSCVTTWRSYDKDNKGDQRQPSGGETTWTNSVRAGIMSMKRQWVLCAFL